MTPEYDDTAFLRENIVDVDAAVIGIGRKRWTSIDGPEPRTYEALDIMSRNRFDVLPIVVEPDVVGYFETDRWGDYSSASLKRVTDRDLIPYNAPLADVIRRFVEESRLFFFLCQGATVVGLISVVNLNCRQVQVYLFSLLCELERHLGEFVTRAGVTDAELAAMFFGEQVKGKHAQLKIRYENDQRNSVELPLVQYLYLSDLVKVVRTKGLYRPLGFASGGKFGDALGPVVTLRDAVAHPVTSLITQADSIRRVWHAVEHILTILPRLRTA